MAEKDQITKPQTVEELLIKVQMGLEAVKDKKQGVIDEKLALEAQYAKSTMGHNGETLGEKDLMEKIVKKDISIAELRGMELFANFILDNKTEGGSTVAIYIELVRKKVTDLKMQLARYKFIDFDDKLKES